MPNINEDLFIRITGEVPYCIQRHLWKSKKNDVIEGANKLHLIALK
jgi:hypothetical protein